MGLDKSMGKFWSHFSGSNSGAGKSAFQAQEIPRFAAADLATIFSTESGLFSEKVSKVFLITSAINEKKDSVGMVISSELCVMLLLCCNFTGLDVKSFSF